MERATTTSHDGISGTDAVPSSTESTKEHQAALPRFDEEWNGANCNISDGPQAACEISNTAGKGASTEAERNAVRKRLINEIIEAGKKHVQGTSLTAAKAAAVESDPEREAERQMMISKIRDFIMEKRAGQAVVAQPNTALARYVKKDIKLGVTELGRAVVAWSKMEALQRFDSKEPSIIGATDINVSDRGHAAANVRNAAEDGFEWKLKATDRF